MGSEGSARVWQDDLLDREAEAIFLQTFLLNRVAERRVQGRPASYVLNLNADWGQGKTFFLNRLARQLEADGYLVAKIDAWADDHAEDPLLPVMLAINKAINADTKRAKAAAALKKVGIKLVAAGVKGVAMQVGHRLAGEAATKEIVDSAVAAFGTTVDKIYDDAGKALIEKFEKSQKSISHFKEQLAAALEDGSSKRKAPLFVLVDELDRCRPTYAIALLERIKHIFEVSNVVFVIATNTEQLRCSIGAVYGANFDSARYLHRFFDRTYDLSEKKDLQAYVENIVHQLQIDPSKFSLPPDEKMSSYLVGGFNHFGFGLRDVEQCLDVLRSTSTVWQHPFPIELSLLFPLIIAQYRDLPLHADSATVKALKELALKAAGPAWRLKFRPYVSGPERRTVSGDTDGLSLFELQCSVVKRSIHDVVNDDASNATGYRWIVEQIRGEVSAASGGGARGSARSVQADYPELVRSAGRLRAGADVP